MKTLICYPAGKDGRKYVVPDTVETIEEFAFYSCDLVPDELKTINSEAFYNCYYLTEINIPGNVETIGSGAFSLCHSLKKLTIPPKCKIGDLRQYRTEIVPILRGRFFDGITKTTQEYCRISRSFRKKRRKRCKQDGYKALKRSLCGIALILSGSHNFNAMVFLGDTPPSVRSTGNENKIFHEIYHPDSIAWDEWLDANTYAWDREKYGITDIPSPWATDETERAKSIGLITERTSYGWQSSITRSEFAELIINELEKAVGRELSPADESCFADTSNIAALKAYNAGIISGTGEAAFSPGDYATREQTAAMLCRAADYIEKETGRSVIKSKAAITDTYTDKDTVSAWAAEAVARLNDAGIMKGVSETLLAPQNTVTVQECILLVKRLYEAS